MYEDNPSAFGFIPDRLHIPAALVCPVTGKNVDVTAPKAFWAMVCIPVSFYLFAAIGTSKVFDVPGKFQTHLKTNSS